MITHLIVNRDGGIRFVAKCGYVSTVTVRDRARRSKQDLPPSGVPTWSDLADSLHPYHKGGCRELRLMGRIRHAMADLGSGMAGEASHSFPTIKALAARWTRRRHTIVDIEHTDRWFLTNPHDIKLDEIWPL